MTLTFAGYVVQFARTRKVQREVAVNHSVARDT